MRTKQVDGVLRLALTDMEPKPSVYIVYDGLGGLSQRPLLRDIAEELGRQGPGVWKNFLTALRAAGSGHVRIYFHDFVSYGIGGGDATAEFFFASRRVFWVDDQHPFRGWKGPGLAMSRMEPIPASPQFATELDTTEERLPLAEVTA